MNALKILWLGCWKKALREHVSRDMAIEIAKLIPKVYFYIFTACASLAGGHIASRHYFQSNMDKVISNKRKDFNYARKSLLPWYDLGDNIEYDVLYRSKYLGNEYCCSYCVMKTYKYAVRDNWNFYDVPVDEKQWKDFWIWGSTYDR